MNNKKTRRKKEKNETARISWREYDLIPFRNVYNTKVSQKWIE